MARICHGYGYTVEYVGDLGIDKLNELTDALDIIEHQQMMVAMKCAQYPHMGKEDHDSLHKYVHRMAYPDAYERARLERLEALKRNVGQ